MRKTEGNDLIVDDKYYLNSDDYEILGDIVKGTLYYVKKDKDNRSQILYAKKQTKNVVKSFYQNEITNLSKELNI